MTGAAIGAALFVLGLAWTFREPRLTGRLWGLGAMALGSLVVVGSYLAVRSGRAEAFDAAARRAATRGSSPRLDRAIGIGTDLGSVYGLAGVAGTLALSRRPRLAGQVMLAGLTAWTAAQGVKPLLHRPRPYELGTSPRLVAPPAGSSWPSGHAAVAAAMATTALPLLPRRHQVGTVVLTAAVGVSRLRMGVHHLTDVMAGFGVGTVSALTVRSAVTWWGTRS